MSKVEGLDLGCDVIVPQALQTRFVTALCTFANAYRHSVEL